MLLDSLLNNVVLVAHHDVVIVVIFFVALYTTQTLGLVVNHDSDGAVRVFALVVRGTSRVIRIQHDFIAALALELIFATKDTSRDQVGTLTMLFGLRLVLACTSLVIAIGAVLRGLIEGLLPAAYHNDLR